MRTTVNNLIKMMWFVTACCFVVNMPAMATETTLPDGNSDMKGYVLVKGKISDSETGSPLTFATISIEGTSIGTISNSEGDFSLKISEQYSKHSLHVSFLGYRDKKVDISTLKPDKNRIALEPLSVSLTEINVFPTDPHLLIKAIIKRKKDNYADSPEIMTAFYREIIKNRRTYASLSEAVVEVYKQSYQNEREDLVKLLKGRKSDDYTKLDTLAFKLMGGPLATLSLDIVKNPYLILDEDVMYKYNYRVVTVTRYNDKLAYVLEFEQRKEIEEPLFNGKIFIDTETLAIISASYQINTSNKAEVSKLFIKRKPAGADVYPTSAVYMVNYVFQDGKWVFGYSRGDVQFKVNWRKKWFNSVYNTSIELAATNWRVDDVERPFKPSDRLKMSVIMNKALEGFSDPDFWGAYNVIEPEKSIEQAIKKIRKSLDEFQER